MYNTRVKINGKKEEIFITNLRMFQIKFLPPTNHNGDRVKIIDTRNGKSVIIGYDFSTRGTLETALKFLIEKGIKYTSFSHDEKSKNYYIMTSDFKTQIK